MEAIINWLSNNKEWFFSGAGVLILGFILKMIFKDKDRTANQIQKSGKKSINIQSGRDVNVNSRNKDEK